MDNAYVLTTGTVCLHPAAYCAKWAQEIKGLITNTWALAVSSAQESLVADLSLLANFSIPEARAVLRWLDGKVRGMASGPRLSVPKEDRSRSETVAFSL